mmetsp:Transcript_23468/g.28685  ORF Transcript_23468/g.28685 Transcript_23468/m.28685 type:complete len:518 (+) Transcript_23468:672-2225(+)
MLVKRRCDKIIKSLKLDMSEALEDRCQIEMDLLNQLSKLDNEKQIMEDEFRVKLQEREEETSRLTKEVERLTSLQNADANSQDAQDTDRNTAPVPDDNEQTPSRLCRETLEQGLNEIEALPSPSSLRAEKQLQKELMGQLKCVTKQKDEMEEELRTELKERRETIDKLVQANVQAQKDITALKQEKDDLRNTIALEYDEMMQMIIKDRQNASSSLERVAAIQEKQANTLDALDALYSKVHTSPQKENNDTATTTPTDTVVTTSIAGILEKAALLHEEVKVSLHLIELKLNNQLEKLKNNQLFLSLANVTQEERYDAIMIISNTREIQEEAIASMRLIEKNATTSFKSFEEVYEAQLAQLMTELEHKNETSKAMEKTISDLEQSLTSSHQQQQFYLNNAQKQVNENADAKDITNPQEDASNSNLNTSSSLSSPSPLRQQPQPPYATNAMMRKLQVEVFTVVERIKEKNEAIGKLTTVVEEHKVREATLKRELKRMKKRVKTMEQDDALTALEKGMSEF